jgi:hypothetical protein
MLFVTRWRRRGQEAALAAAVERPLDLAHHPAARQQQEQAALVDSLLRQLEQKNVYIRQLESVLAESPCNGIDAEFAGLSVAGRADVVSPQDLAQLRGVFTSAGILFPEPLPGLSAPEVLLWMMHWIVDHLLGQSGRPREEGE